MNSEINISRKNGKVKIEVNTIPVQINEEEKEKRAQRRLARNAQLVKDYPIGSYVRKNKGVVKRIIGVNIDPYHYDRPTFIMVSTKTKATTYIASNKIESYTIIP